MVSRYEKLYQHAQREYEQVSQVLTEVARQLEEAQQQLESLQNYVQTLAQPEQPVAQHQKLMQQRHFVLQVFTAIEHQTQQVHQLEQQHAHVKKQWLEKRARLKGLEKLIAKGKQAKQAAEEKKVQRALDERSSWAYGSRKNKEP